MNTIKVSHVIEVPEGVFCFHSGPGNITCDHLEINGPIAQCKIFTMFSLKRSKSGDDYVFKCFACKTLKAVQE